MVILQNKVVTSLHYPMFHWACMLCWCNRQCNLVAYQSTLVFHQHHLFGWECSCSFFEVDVTEKKEASPQSLLGSYVKDKFYKQTNKQNLFLHIITTRHNLHWPQTVTVWSCGIGKYPCLIYYCLACNKHLIFLLQVHRLSNFMFCFLEMSVLEVTAGSSGEVCTYRLMFLVPWPSYVCFCSTEVSCCIAVVCLLGGVRI